MREIILSSLKETVAALERLSSDDPALSAIDRGAALMTDALAAGGRILACGNGGSMCDAMHFAEELTGRFRRDRQPFAALAVSDPAHLSCTANDYGYEHVFSRYVEAIGREGDVLVAISTSGRSPNVVNAAQAAGRRGMSTVALTGRRESPLADAATVEICTPAGAFADRVQEQHIVVLHILVELVERRLIPENYATAD